MVSVSEDCSQTRQDFHYPPGLPKKRSRGSEVRIMGNSPSESSEHVLSISLVLRVRDYKPHKHYSMGVLENSQCL